jgi:pilus assembly protein Flp/PilA
MKAYIDRIWKHQIRRDSRGQDLIEYALLAGFVAVAAGAILPGAARDVLSKVTSLLGTVFAQNSAK